MRWFRFYDEVLDDPKVQKLPAHLFKHWVNLLCIASRHSVRGRLPDMADLVFSIRLSEEDTQGIIRELLSRGLLDKCHDGSLTPHGWAGRQYLSDDVSARVRKHRKKDDETLHETFQGSEGNVPGNVTETFPHGRADQTRPDQTNTRDRVIPDQTRPDPHARNGTQEPVHAVGSVGGGLFETSFRVMVEEGFSEIEIRNAITDLEEHPTKVPARNPASVLRKAILRRRVECPDAPAVPPVVSDADAYEQYLRAGAKREAEEVERRDRMTPEEREAGDKRKKVAAEILRLGIEAKDATEERREAISARQRELIRGGQNAQV